MDVGEDDRQILCSLTTGANEETEAVRICFQFMSAGETNDERQVQHRQMQIEGMAGHDDALTADA